MQVLVKFVGENWPPELRGKQEHVRVNQVMVDGAPWIVGTGFELEAVPEVRTEHVTTSIADLSGGKPSRIEIDF